ncbi:MAG: hypothetical protein R3A12_11430 [Ignavibacteria bacterium]
MKKAEVNQNQKSEAVEETKNDKPVSETKEETEAVENKDESEVVTPMRIKFQNQFIKFYTIIKNP